MVHYLTIIYIYDIYVCISCAIILIFNKTHKIGCCENCYWLGWFDIWRVKSGSLNYHGRFYVTRPFLYLERYIPIKTFVFLLLLLCIEKARGETVRFFSPRCHIMPKWAHVPWKTVEWSSHLCEIWSHCVSTTSHTQFRWLGMVKGWCIAPA